MLFQSLKSSAMSAVQTLTASSAINAIETVQAPVVSSVVVGATVVLPTITYVYTHADTETGFATPMMKVESAEETKNEEVDSAEETKDEEVDSAVLVERTEEEPAKKVVNKTKRFCC